MLLVAGLTLAAYMSRSVVSRVLNSHPHMSDETRRRVLEAVFEHEYRPSSVARSVATDRTFEASVLTPQREGDMFGNSIYLHLHTGIFERCMECGYYLSLSMVAVERGGDIEQHFLGKKHLDGFSFITREVTQFMAAVAMCRRGFVRSKR